MDEFLIDLHEVGPSGSGGTYRARDDKGKRFPQLLVDEGNKTQVKGKLMIAIHGHLEPGGDPASLLIFEFNLTTSNERRFKQATITITFEDGPGSSSNDPEVYEIGPCGLFALNKETDSKDVTHAADAAINANPVPALGGSLGYHWTMSTTVSRTHSATLNGMSKKFKPSGEETAAVWVMEEDPVKNEGIPSFLRTAVVLRHDPDEGGEFNFSLEIDAKEAKLFYGKSKPSKMLKPLVLDPKVFALMKKEGVDTDKLGTLNLESQYQVTFAKALNI